MYSTFVNEMCFLTLQLLLHTERGQGRRVGAVLSLRHPLLVLSKEVGAFPTQVNTSAIEDK